jgi:hypothetical protein
MATMGRAESAGAINRSTFALRLFVNFSMIFLSLNLWGDMASIKG